jgi:RNA polymerase sigma-70 factor (ECF subfamily)
VNHEPLRPCDGKPEVEPNCCAQRLEEAFARWQGELVGTLYFLVGNVEDARDVLQETFIKAWRQRHKLDEVENLKAWLFRIALNTGRDLRQSAWRRKKQALPADDGALACACDTPQQLLSAREEQTMLRAAIASLRPEEQEVFLLRQNGELTYEEIAEALAIPTGTVKTRMRLAVQKLKAAVAEV